MIHYLIIDSSNFGTVNVYDLDDPIFFNRACSHFNGIHFICDLIDFLNSKLPKYSCIIMCDDDFEVFNRKIDDDVDYRLYYCHDFDDLKDLFSHE